LVKNSAGKTPKAPVGYTPEARRLWHRVLHGWDLDAAALAILDTACRGLMRVRQAQTLLATDGIVVKDRFGQDKAHPAAAIEHAAAQTMLRNLRALNLDLEPLNDRSGRPPGD
jgi:phage terminase small subunit